MASTVQAYPHGCESRRTSRTEREDSERQRENPDMRRWVRLDDILSADIMIHTLDSLINK
jgi:hypothetical protein